MRPTKEKRGRGSIKGSNSMGGRRLSKEWIHVKKTADGIYRCKYCKHIVSGKIHRIRKHLENCRSFKNKNTAKETSRNGDNDSSTSNSGNESSTGSISSLMLLSESEDGETQAKGRDTKCACVYVCNKCGARAGSGFLFNVILESI